jgi:hypothetical protein
MEDKIQDVTQKNDGDSCNTQTTISNHEPDFIPLIFTVDQNNQIVLWKEHARHHQQWEGTQEQYLRQTEQMLKQLANKYGAPLGSLRLYDNGLVTLGLKYDALTAKLSVRSIKAGEDAWDEFYPDVAEAARNATRELLASIDKQKAMSQYLSQLSDEELHVKMMPTGLKILSRHDGTPVEEQLLNWMLETSAEKLAIGENPVLVGILTQTGMAVIPCNIPYEKYCFARCISDTAEQVNAKNVLIVFDAYQLDENGNRIGEVLLGTIFDPKGVARGCSMKYIRENDNIVLQDTSEMCHLPGGNLRFRWKEEAAA